MNRLTRGFTLVEMLVVVAIIVLIIAMLLPSMAMAREMTRRTVCLNNQHQLHEASILYSQDNAGYLPNRSANHNWDAGGWAQFGSGDFDNRNVWIGYLGGFTIDGGSEMLLCPSVKASPYPVCNGTQALGTWINQGWPVIAWGLRWYNSSYAYFAQYKVAPVLGKRITRTNAPGGLTLLNDMVRRDGWNQHTGNHSAGGGAIPHASPLMPSGANATALDGRGRWVAFTGFDDISAANGMEKYVTGSPSAGQWWAKQGQ